MSRYILALLLLLPTFSFAETLADYPGFNIVNTADKRLLFSHKNKFGIADISGHVLIKPEYAKIHSFSKHIGTKTNNRPLLATKDSIPGVLDNSGNWKALTQLQSLIENGVKLGSYYADQNHQLFVATMPDNKVGVVDLEGKWVIRPAYKRISGTWLPTLNGTVSGYTDQGTDIFDMEGKLLLKSDAVLTPLGEGYAARHTPDGKQLIRLDGTKVLDEKFESLGIILDGMISYRKKPEAGGSSIQGYLRINNGNIEHGFVSGFWFSGAEPYFSEGRIFGCPTPAAMKNNSEYARFFANKKSGGCAYFDRNGKPVGNSSYYSGSNFIAGRTAVFGYDDERRKTYGAWINREGKVLAAIDLEAHLWDGRSNENVAIFNTNKLWILFYPDGATKEFDFLPIQ
jgi:hypothetical protein